MNSHGIAAFLDTDPICVARRKGDMSKNAPLGVTLIGIA